MMNATRSKSQNNGRLITSSPWGFRLYTFEKFARFMKKIGITDLCMMFGDSARFPLALSPTPSAVRECIKHANDLGLRFLEVATTLDYRKELPLAATLGVKYFRVCDHWENTEIKFIEIADMLRDMGGEAGRYGITVIVENHGGLTAKAASCRRLLEEVGLKNVKLNYDPANFLYYGDDPVKALDDVLPLVAFTHFKSVKYTDGKPRYCRVAEGDIDYRPIFNMLLPSYKGYLGLEYEEPSNVEQGTLEDYEALRALLSKCGS